MCIVFDPASWIQCLHVLCSQVLVLVANGGLLLLLSAWLVYLAVQRRAVAHNALKRMTTALSGSLSSLSAPRLPNCLMHISCRFNGRNSTAEP